MFGLEPQVAITILTLVGGGVGWLAKGWMEGKKYERQRKDDETLRYNTIIDAKEKRIEELTDSRFHDAIRINEAVTQSSQILERLVHDQDKRLGDVIGKLDALGTKIDILLSGRQP